MSCFIILLDLVRTAKDSVLVVYWRSWRKISWRDQSETIWNHGTGFKVTDSS